MNARALLSSAALACAGAFAFGGLAGAAKQAVPGNAGLRPSHAVAAKPSPAPTEDPGMRYRAIGPAVSGGRVSAVAGSDRDPALYYAGAAGGGLWQSTNGGLTWRDVWLHASFGAIGAVEIDPQRDATVWVGTGESNPRNDVSWGDGMYRSTDGAKTWRHFGLAATKHIARISIDPQHSEVVVVAALGDPYVDSPDRGVYRTVDGGRTWRKTLFLDGSTGAADLARDPKDARILYAAMWRYRRRPWSLDSGGGRDGLYASRDGGATWRHVAGHGFPAASLGRIGIAIAPSKPSRVYAVVQSKAGTIWRSDDAGADWIRASSETMPAQRPFYFSHLAVDPRDPTRVVAVSMYLSQSKNSGRTWKHLATTIHVDNHALWWSRDGKRLLDGNDGGVALSNDAGASWLMPLDLPIGQIYHVGFSLDDPYRVCAGFQDNSAWCGPSQSRNGIGIIDRDWTAVLGGDGTWAIPDPADPHKVWTDSQDGALTIFDEAAQQGIDIEPWPRDAFTSLRGLADNRYRFNWSSPLAFSPADPHTAYFGGNVVFKTTDAGRSWTPISGDLTRDEKAHQLPSGGAISLDVSGAEAYDTLLVIAPSTADPRMLWAGSDDGLVHVTRDGGTSWHDVSPPGPRYARVESIDPARDDAATAYVALDRHDLGDRSPYLVATHDGGATWRRIDGGLPRDASTHVVRVDPKHPNILYAGTERGVYYSTTGGARWLPLQFNLPATPVFDLQVQPKANDLIVATHGRSLWILDDLTPIQNAAQVGRDPVIFPIRAGTMWAQSSPIETGDGNSLYNGGFVGANPAGPALITFFQRAPAARRPEFAIVDAAGNTIRHLRGSFDTDDGKKFWVTNVAGYNRLGWDGSEDGPVRWHGTSLQNMGPLAGAEALPGTYTIRLTIDGRSYAQPFVLKADPRSPWTPDQLAQRHAYMRQLYRDVSEIDVLLNAIDAQAKALRHGGRAASQRLSQLVAVRDGLTANDRVDEDGIARPDRLRERLLAAGLGALQPPFAAHRASLQDLQAEFDRRVPAWRALVMR